MNEAQILKIIPGLQATALLGKNIKFAKDSHKFKPKKFTKGIIKTGVENIVGISLLNPTSTIIGSY